MSLDALITFDIEKIKRFNCFFIEYLSLVMYKFEIMIHLYPSISLTIATMNKELSKF